MKDIKISISDEMYEWLRKKSEGYGLDEGDAIVVEAAAILNDVFLDRMDLTKSTSIHKSQGANLAIERFIDLFIVQDPDAFVSKNELYETFQDFCRRSHQGVRLSKKSFYRYLYPLLNARQITYVYYYPSIKGKRTTSLRGFQLKFL